MSHSAANDSKPPRSWVAPTADQVQRALDSTADQARARYFYGRLENPLWVRPLREMGVFDEVPEPAPQPDGTVLMQPVPQLEYLARVAADESQSVTEIVRQLGGTENAWAQRELLRCLLRIPATEAAALSDLVVAWIRSPYARLWRVDDDVFQLIGRLVAAGQAAPAIRILRALFRAVDEDYWIQRCLTLLRESLRTLGVDAVQLIVDALADRLSETRHTSSWSSSTRPSIEPHVQNHGNVEDALVDGLLDLLGSLNDQLLHEALHLLLRTTGNLYRRIAYYELAQRLVQLVAAEPGDSVRQELLGLARELLTVEGAAQDEDAVLEYMALARAALPAFSDYGDDVVATLLADVVRAGPELTPRMRDADPADVERYTDRWRAERIALLQGIEPEPLATVAREVAARGAEPPEHPGFRSWFESWSGPESPLDDDALHALSVDEVARTVQQYDGPVDASFAPSVEGLARAVAHDVERRPDSYAAAATEFESARAPYARALFDGWRQVLATSKGDGVRLDWDEVTRVALLAAQRSEAGGTPTESGIDSPRWLHRSVAFFILTALDVQADGLDAAAASRLVDVISVLAASPDPETETEDQDPDFVVLNSVRGLALLALIETAHWLHRQRVNEADFPPDLVELLDRHLDPHAEPIAAIRSAYGRGFVKLYLALPGWISRKVDAIFGAGIDLADIRQGTTREAENDSAGRTAFDAFLASSQAHPKLYRLLERQYAREITHLRDPARRRLASHRDSRALLLDHLLRLTYVNSDDGSPVLTVEAGGPLDLALRFAGPEAAGEAIGRLGWQVFRSDVEPTDTVQRRLKELWSWWREKAERRHAAGDRQASVAMLSEFSWWWRATAFDADWQMDELVRVLAVAPEIDAPGEVVELLVSRLSGRELSAVRALELLLPDIRERWELDHTIRRAAPALSRLIAVPDSGSTAGVARRALELVDKIARWGWVEVAQEIRHAPVDAD